MICGMRSGFRFGLQRDRDRGCGSLWFQDERNEPDGYIWAFIYGSITFRRFGGHMVGARLWRYGKHDFALWASPQACLR